MPVSIFRLPVAVVLAIAVQPLIPLSLQADEISRWDDMYRECVADEDEALTQLQTNWEHFNDRSGIFVGTTKGGYAYFPEDQLRRMIQHAVTIIQLGVGNIDEAYLNRQPLGRRVVIKALLASGMAVDGAMLRLKQLDAQIRKFDRARTLESIELIEAELEKARACALEAIEKRNATRQRRDVGGAVCFDDTVPADGEATHGSVYGGGKYPVKGSYICTGWQSFLWDTGGSISEYRCAERNSQSTANCHLANSVGYESETVDGNLVYHLENGAHITFHFGYTRPPL